MISIYNIIVSSEKGMAETNTHSEEYEEIKKDIEELRVRIEKFKEKLIIFSEEKITVLKLRLPKMSKTNSIIELKEYMDTSEIITEKSYDSQDVKSIKTKESISSVTVPWPIKKRKIQVTK